MFRMKNKNKMMKNFFVKTFKLDPPFLCSGVLRKHDEPIHWCCLITEREIQYKKPGDLILYYKNNAALKCQTGWTGRNCDACAPNFEPPGQCDHCLRGWTGRNCDVCSENFGPVGQCDRCVTGWAGENCDTCARGWTGDNCTECATNFGPVGQCDRCLLGWAGNNCNVCDFGFSTESNCTECIQNEKWTGTYGHNKASMRAFLTFEGAACNNLEPGMFHIGLYQFIEPKCPKLVPDELRFFFTVADHVTSTANCSYTKYKYLHNSTIGPVATRSLFGLVMVRSVRTLLECFFVWRKLTSRSHWKVI